MGVRQEGKRENKRQGVLLKNAGNLVATGLAAGVGWLLYSRLFINHEVSLGEAIPAERVQFPNAAAGLLSFYVEHQVEGHPLVLIHSVNAAASAYEMRPLFLCLRSERPVYALDLPGFGFSQRSAHASTPNLYAEAIHSFLSSQVGKPADVVALSLSAEFAALAAISHPEAFRSLVLISPTGFQQSDDRFPPPPQNTPTAIVKASRRSALYSALTYPLWDRALFDLIVTRKSIQYFLGRQFVGPIPFGIVDYAYATAHQPGAQHAPLYFLSGRTFTPQVRQRVYTQIGMPTLVLYDRDPNVRFDALDPFLQDRPQWRAHRIQPSLGLPHFEKLSDTIRILQEFWDNHT